MRAFSSASTIFALLIVALAGPTFASHCYPQNCVVGNCQPYCCSIGCDSPHNPAGNTCGQPGQVTEASIFAIAQSGGCSPLTTGSCSYAPAIADRCVASGLCPQGGCGGGVIATPGPVPPPSPPPVSAPPPTPPPTPPRSRAPTEAPTTPGPTVAQSVTATPTTSTSAAATTGSSSNPDATTWTRAATENSEHDVVASTPALTTEHTDGTVLASGGPGSGDDEDNGEHHTPPTASGEFPTTVPAITAAPASDADSSTGAASTDSGGGGGGGAAMPVVVTLLLLAIAATALYVLFQRRKQAQKAEFARMETELAPNTKHAMMDNPVYSGTLLGPSGTDDRRYSRLNVLGGAQGDTPPLEANESYLEVGCTPARPESVYSALNRQPDSPAYEGCIATTPDDPGLQQTAVGRYHTIMTSQQYGTVASAEEVEALRRGDGVYSTLHVTGVYQACNGGVPSMQRGASLGQPVTPASPDLAVEIDATAAGDVPASPPKGGGSVEPDDEDAYTTVKIAFSVPTEVAGEEGKAQIASQQALLVLLLLAPSLMFLGGLTYDDRRPQSCFLRAVSASWKVVVIEPFGPAPVYHGTDNEAMVVNRLLLDNVYAAVETA